MQRVEERRRGITLGTGRASIVDGSLGPVPAGDTPNKDQDWEAQSFNSEMP